MFVHVTGQQRNVGFFGEHRVVVRSQLQQFVVLLEVKQIICEIDHHIPVRGKFLDGFPANVRGFLILALETQVPLFFSHEVRFLLHFVGGAAQPLRRMGKCCVSIAAFIPPATIRLLVRRQCHNPCCKRHQLLAKSRRDAYMSPKAR